MVILTNNATNLKQENIFSTLSESNGIQAKQPFSL